VGVHFAATKGNCKTIDLVIGGEIVASYENPANVKQGDHTFVDVDISAILNEQATLSAVAYQGNRNAAQGGSDPEAEGASIEVQYGPPPSPWWKQHTGMSFQAWTLPPPSSTWMKWT